METINITTLFTWNKRIGILLGSFFFPQKKKHHLSYRLIQVCGEKSNVTLHVSEAHTEAEEKNAADDIFAGR